MTKYTPETVDIDAIRIVQSAEGVLASEPIEWFAARAGNAWLLQDARYPLAFDHGGLVVNVAWGEWILFDGIRFAVVSDPWFTHHYAEQTDPADERIVDAAATLDEAILADHEETFGNATGVIAWLLIVEHGDDGVYPAYRSVASENVTEAYALGLATKAAHS